MYEKGVAENADLVICDFALTDGIDNNVTKTGCYNSDIEFFIDNLLFQREDWSLCNKLYKRDVYSSDVVFPNGNMGEDMALTLQIILNCHVLAYLPQVFYYYYHNPSSITKKKTELNIFNSFNQVVENVNLIAKLYQSKQLTTQRISGLRFLKWHQKSLLLPLVNQRVYCKLWRKTFPGIEKEMVFDRNQTPRERIKSFLALINPNLLRQLQK